MSQVLYRPTFRHEKSSDPRFSDLHRSISKIFDDRLFPATTTEPADWSPSVDIFEQETTFLLRTDLPGVKIEDIELTLDKNVLTLSGSRSTDIEQPLDTDSTSDNTRFTRRERRTGTFARKFTLPELADGENISATTSDGVLTLTIPKTKQAQPKTIAITQK